MSEFVTYHVLRFLQGIEERFTFASGYRGSLFLLAGGLFLLTFLILYAFAKSLIGRAHTSRRRPASRPVVHVGIRAPPGEARALRRGHPQANFEAGWRDGAAAAATDLDGIFDKFHAAGLGDVRILATGPTTKNLRVFACSGCDGKGDFRGCAYEAGFLAGAFSRLLRGEVRIRETACSKAGQAHCDFEVTYA